MRVVRRPFILLIRAYEYPVRTIYALLAVFSTGLYACASAPEVVVRQVPVEVVKTQYVSLSPALLDPCPDQPAPLGSKPLWSEERNAALQYQNVWAVCMLQKLRSIAELQPY